MTPTLAELRALAFDASNLAVSSNIREIDEDEYAEIAGGWLMNKVPSGGGANEQPRSAPMSDTPTATYTNGNGVTARPPVDEEESRMARIAEELCQEAPSALTATGHQTIIPVVNKPLPHEYFQTHALQLTMLMVTPKKGSIGAHSYAVMPRAVPFLARQGIEPFLATLYPIVISSRPFSYKMIIVKTPTRGGRWDDWNLSKKLVLDEALGNWRAMRSFNGGYRAQLAMFDDDCARRHEFREKIDALIKEPCGHNRDHIVSIYVRSREHYHPGRPRSECDKALLRRMLDDTLLGGLSAAA